MIHSNSNSENILLQRTLGHICKAAEKEVKAAEKEAKAAEKESKAAAKASAKATAKADKAKATYEADKQAKTPSKAAKAPKEKSTEKKLNMSRKCVHSRAWHGAREKALKEGKSKVEAKKIAKLAGHEAQKNWDDEVSAEKSVMELEG